MRGSVVSTPAAGRSRLRSTLPRSISALSGPVRVDVLLAAVVGVQGAVELALAAADGGLPRGGLLVQGVYLAGVAAAVALRTVSPEWSAGMYLLATVMVCSVSRPVELLAVGLAFTVLPFLYAISLDGRRFALVLGTLLVAIAVRSLDDPGQDWFAKLLDQFWVLQSAAAGLVVRRYRRRADRLGDAAAERARDAVELERARIARELHDVVGHQVTAMIVTADAARGALEDALDRIFGPTPGPGAAATPAAHPNNSLAKDGLAATDALAAKDALAAIEATGRQCLAEMRHLVGLLRQGLEGSAAEDDVGPAAPPGGLDALDELLRRTRAAGLPVRLDTVGARRPVSTAIELAVYRVVQESLTNTLRHAGPAQAVVSLGWADEELTVLVQDFPATAGPRGPAHGFGAGLIGLRERVRLFGGTFSAGPAPSEPGPGQGTGSGGGWGVHAVFPLPTNGSRPLPSARDEVSTSVDGGP